ncbi:MAG: hypothetical protein COV44_06605 [Deltaproteobacteria bacterium CG11_big_fil_rev_8_21_14_0_20_45_16]|nr:MAG: hypothetical protein COV44_06605 [Deltaproteobacteria bacterium CG11_big_fil_rev_8_21_14_0_20_45_16]
MSDSNSASLKTYIKHLVRTDTEIFLKACRELKAELAQRLTQTHMEHPELIPLKIKDLDRVFEDLSDMREVLNIRAPSLVSGSKDAAVSKSPDKVKDLELECIVPDTDLSFQEVLRQAEAAFKSKSYEQALKHFEQMGMEIKKCSSNIILRAGTAAFYSDRLAVAEEYSNEVLSREKSNVQALTLKAMVYMKREKFSYAFDLLTQAHRLNPHSQMIEKFLKMTSQQLQSRMTCGFTESSKANQEAKRRWQRAPINGSVQINSLDDHLVRTHRLLSLSAGGCLIEAEDCPEEFQIIIQISGEQSIWTLCRKLYAVDGKYLGLQFIKISKEDEKYINFEVGRALKFRAA